MSPVHSPPLPPSGPSMPTPDQSTQPQLSVPPQYPPTGYRPLSLPSHYPPRPQYPPTGYRPLSLSSHHPPHLHHPPETPASPHPQPLRQSTDGTTAHHYRSWAEYNAQNTPWHSNCTRDALLWDAQEAYRARSVSVRSGYGSSLHEHVESGIDPTLSPIDPRLLQQWEADHSRSQSRWPSRSGSYLGKDGEENRTINASLDAAPLIYTPASLCQVKRSIGDEQHDGFTGLDNTGLREPQDHTRDNTEFYPSRHHQEQFLSLQKDTVGSNGTESQELLGLNSLVDGHPAQRPPYTLATIIECAILGSPHQRLTLSELYLAMETRFVYYRNSDQDVWRNSVRNALSLKGQFAKKERGITDHGRGNYWVVAGSLCRTKRKRKGNRIENKSEPEQLAPSSLQNRVHHPSSTPHRHQGPWFPASGSNAQPQFVEPWLRLESPAQWANGAASISHQFTPASKVGESSSSSRVHPSPARSRHRYNHTAPFPSSPSKPFSDLASQVRGAAPATCRKSSKGKGRAEEWDNEHDKSRDDDNSDEYLPRKRTKKLP